MADVVGSVATGAAVAPGRPRAKAVGSRRRVAWSLRTVVVLYVGVLVLVPVATLVYRAFRPGLSELLDAITDRNAVHAYEVSAVVTAWSVVINVVFGVAVAILLARHRFPGKRLLSAFVDLPVAVSPIVVGLAIVLVYGPNGWFGLSDTSGTGLQITGATPGMVLATVFVSLPLVVRAVVPVLEQAGTDQEQAAASLGAHAVARFRRITLPTIRVALSYGIVLCLARCLGEYGAVLIVSNNVEGQTETAPLRIGNLINNEQNYNAAYAITLVLMLVAFAAIAASALLRHRKKA